MGEDNGFFEASQEAKEIKHWEDMPEFEQKKNDAFRKIIVSFVSEKDAQDFGKLLKQNVTANTKSLWYPPKDKPNTMDIWVDSP